MESKADMSKFWKSCNKAEKILFVLAQVCACVLPFMLLTMQWNYVLWLWISGAASVLLLCILKQKRTGERYIVSLLPKINFRK